MIGIYLPKFCKHASDEFVFCPYWQICNVLRYVTDTKSTTVKPHCDGVDHIFTNDPATGNDPTWVTRIEHNTCRRTTQTSTDATIRQSKPSQINIPQTWTT